MFEANISGVAVKIDFDTLPVESRAFVIDYGLRQYIQDGAAISAKHLSGDAKGQEKTEEEKAEERRTGVQARIDNLLAGTFTRRSAGAAKQTPEEREREAYIMAALQAAARAAGVKLPTKTGKAADPERLATLQANYYAKYQAKVDKEVARRLRAAATEEPVDLDAIGLA